MKKCIYCFLADGSANQLDRSSETPPSGLASVQFSTATNGNLSPGVDIKRAI